MERTTNISLIENDGAGFTWGNINKIYKIGEYTIAEYNPWKIEGCRCLTGVASEHIEYYVWIGNENTSRGFCSLEAAMIGAIAYKYDGANSQAGSLFCRALGIKDEN